MARSASFSVGDKVRWKTGDNMTYGRIVGEETDGTASSSGGNYDLEGSEGRPAYRTQVASYSDGSWVVDGKTTVHRGSELTKIEDFPEDGPSSA